MIEKFPAGANPGRAVTIASYVLRGLFGAAAVAALAGATALVINHGRAIDQADAANATAEALSSAPAASAPKSNGPR